MKNVILSGFSPLSLIKRFFRWFIYMEYFSPRLYKKYKGFYPQSYYGDVREKTKIIFSQCFKEARPLTDEEIEKFCVKKTENRLFFVGTFESNTTWQTCSNNTGYGGDDDFSINLTISTINKNKLGNIQMFIDNTKIAPKLNLPGILSTLESSWDIKRRGYQILDYMNYYREGDKEWGGYIALLFGENPSNNSGLILLTYIM